MHFSIRRGRGINLAALMAQKRWRDNAVISGRWIDQDAADSGINPRRFHIWSSPVLWR
jgi:hypothetical protein